jgi:hypothetical protein
LSLASGIHSFSGAVLLVRALLEGRFSCIAWANLLLHESWGPPFFCGPLIQAARSFFWEGVSFRSRYFPDVYCCSSGYECVNIKDVTEHAINFYVLDVFFSDLLPADH